MNKTLEFLIKPFRRQNQQAAVQAEPARTEVPISTPPEFELEPGDPLNDYFRANPSVALLEKIQ